MSQNIVNISSQMIQFPKGGSRKEKAQAGVHSLDFNNGLVTFPDGSSEGMSSSLGKIEKQFVKSIFITLSTVDAKIKIGSTVLPKSHQLTYVVNGIGFDNMTIEFPTNRTPKDDFSYMVIASDSDVFPITADSLIGSHNPEAKTGTTTNSDITVIDFIFVGFSENEIIIENTGVTNTMIATVEISQDGVNWVPHQGYPADVLPSDFNVFASSVKHRYLRVRLKAKVSGAQTTYRVQLSLER